MNGFSCAAAVWLKSIEEVGVLEGVILYGRQLGVTECVYQQEIWASNTITLLLVARIQLSIGLQHLQSSRWLTWRWFLPAAHHMLHQGIDLAQSYPLILARNALLSSRQATHWCCAGRNLPGLVLQEKGEGTLSCSISLTHFKEAEGIFIPFNMGVFPTSGMTFPPACRDVPGSWCIRNVS